MSQPTLSDAIQQFLDAELYSRSESELCENDKLIIEAAETLSRLLRRRAARAGVTATAPVRGVDSNMLTVMRSYNDINRDYDLLETDISLAEVVRKGRGGNR